MVDMLCILKNVQKVIAHSRYATYFKKCSKSYSSNEFEEHIYFKFKRERV